MLELIQGSRVVLPHEPCYRVTISVGAALIDAKTLIPAKRRALAWPNFLERYVISPDHAQQFVDEAERDRSRRCCVYAIALRAYAIHQRTEFLSNCVNHAAIILGLDPEKLPTFPQPTASTPSEQVNSGEQLYFGRYEARSRQVTLVGLQK